MTVAEVKALGYSLIKASRFEVGLVKNGVGVRTWWASEFGGKMPPLDHSVVQESVRANERIVKL